MGSTICACEDGTIEQVAEAYRYAQRLLDAIFGRRPQVLPAGHHPKKSWRCRTDGTDLGRHMYIHLYIRSNE